MYDKMNPTYNDFTAVAVEHVDFGATLKLDLPETGNAFNGTMHDELTEALYRLNGDERVRVVVLTGSGNEFCGGGDPEFIKNLQPSQYEENFLTVRRLMANILNFDKPLIGAINGNAVGVGATVALCCDIIVLADDAEIADPHVQFGLAAGDGGGLMWALQAGLPVAKYHLMTGEPINAQRALEVGLVNEVLPRAEVGPRAAEIAARLADSPGQAVRGTKRLLNKIATTIGAGVLDLAAEIERQTLNSADHREAVSAHFEERDPVWTDR
jgi:enoyl-CoA hydratase